MASINLIFNLQQENFELTEAAAVQRDKEILLSQIGLMIVASNDTNTVAEYAQGGRGIVRGF